MYILQVKQGLSETRGVDNSVYFIMWGKRKGDSSGLKLHCDSDANNNEEKKQEAISYTNTLSFAAREHALLLI